MNDKKQILLIEDEPALAVVIKDYLIEAGMDVSLLHEGTNATQTILQDRPDLVILDIMLPKINGYEVCRLIRKEGIDVPILMLTAKDGEFDEAEALDTGADDFLSKPFSFVVLVARLRALLRREVTPRPAVLEVGAVADATVRVKSGGILEIHVTPRVPVALWRQDDGLHLIDRDGTDMGAVATRADRPDLLLVAGDGAKGALGEATAIMAAARPIAPHLRGLVRMGDRRWDLVLERGQRIMLPQDNAIAALQRVVVMAQTQDLLERDIVAVDMRNPDRPTIRLTGGAAAEMRQINAAVSGTGN